MEERDSRLDAEVELTGAAAGGGEAGATEVREQAGEAVGTGYPDLDWHVGSLPDRPSGAPAGLR